MPVVVREARASDKEPLMAFVSKTWGGHDYLPSVWDDWLRDRTGRIFVVESDGEQVGMNRLRFLKDGTGWLEGVRIRPDFRGKGLASLLGKKSMEYASKFGVTTFRLTSSSRNLAAHRQVSKMGFTEVARFNVFKPTKRSKLRAQAGVRRLSPRNLRAAMDSVQGSDEYRLGKGVYWDSFVVPILDRNALAELIEKGDVFSAKDNKRSSAMAICGLVKEGQKPWRQISFLCGKPALCNKLVSHLFRGSGTKRYEGYVFLPKGSRLANSLKEIGLKKDFQMILFEGRTS